MFSILQIDDLESMHELMKALLARRPGVRLLSVDNGPQGIAMAKAEQPDLILLDVDMPKMGGPKVLTRLKADSTVSDIPVVIVSGSAEENVIASMLANGALCHLPKPFSAQSLFALLDTFGG